MARQHYISCDVIDADGTACLSREVTNNPRALPKGWSQIKTSKPPAPRVGQVPSPFRGGMLGMMGKAGKVGKAHSARLRQLLTDPVAFLQEGYARLRGTITDSPEDRHMRTILEFVDELFPPAAVEPEPDQVPAVEQVDLAQDLAQPASVPLGNAAAPDGIDPGVIDDMVAADDEPEDIDQAYASLFGEALDEVCGVCCPLHPVPTIKPPPRGPYPMGGMVSVGDCC